MVWAVSCIIKCASGAEHRVVHSSEEIKSAMAFEPKWLTADLEIVSSSSTWEPGKVRELIYKKGRKIRIFVRHIESITDVA